MNKSIEQLEQEAELARYDLYAGMLGYFPLNPEVAGDITNKIIAAAVAEVTYQFALAAQETEPEPVRNILRPPRIDMPSAMIGPYSNAPEVAVWNIPPEVMACIKEYFEKQEVSGDAIDN